jgi:nucleotidyltransferase substrate binding protein (TIGR01987 family)
VDSIDTTYLKRCITALARAHEKLLVSDKEDIEYDIYRSAVVKEFEIILEQSGKLLKKKIRPYLHSNKAADQLYFKEVFRHAGLYSLLTLEQIERWMLYRDNRNATSHDYGEEFANQTLKLIPQFIQDAQHLAEVIDANQG